MKKSDMKKVWYKHVHVFLEHAPKRGTAGSYTSAYSALVGTFKYFPKCVCSLTLPTVYRHSRCLIFLPKLDIYSPLSYL